jgi:hypothetical protein
VHNRHPAARHTSRQQLLSKGLAHGHDSGGKTKRPAVELVVHRHAHTFIGVAVVERNPGTSIIGPAQSDQEMRFDVVGLDYIGMK